MSTYYSIIILTLYNNLELWKSFINKTFLQDETLRIDGKHISQIFDSEYFDKHTEYVASKALRNRVTYFQMPFSDICTYDDGTRHYLVFKKDLLSDNSSQKKKEKEYLNADKAEFYDLNVIIDKTIEFIT